MAVEYIGHNGVDGMSFGTAATDKLSFYGATTVDKPASADQAAAASVVTTTATTTHLKTTVANLRTLLNQIRTDLVELGLIKGSA